MHWFCLAVECIYASSGYQHHNIASKHNTRTLASCLAHDACSTLIGIKLSYHNQQVGKWRIWEQENVSVLRLENWFMLYKIVLVSNILSSFCTLIWIIRFFRMITWVSILAFLMSVFLSMKLKYLITPNNFTWVFIYFILFSVGYPIRYIQSIQDIWKTCYQKIGAIFTQQNSRYQ